ncbi:MAG: peptide deformylase [Candidatus Omnitrophica bacterium]|nr:peptide deformylase [Candidatus Omnitrophota bacterium]
MALLRIRVHPDPILHKKAEPITEFDKKLQKLIDNMIETMFTDDGVGLAAPQIGVSQCLFIACPEAKPGTELVFINPQVIETQGWEIAREGCLSLPGISGEVPRAKKIRFRYQDRTGESHELEVKDFFARVIQHEMDHIDGILLIDRVDIQQRQKIMAEYQLL